MNSKNRILIEQFLDGSINEENARQLMCILKEKPDIRQEVVRHFTLKTLLTSMKDEREFCSRVRRSVLSKRTSESFVQRMKDEFEKNEMQRNENADRTFKLRWYTQVRYAALLMAGLLLSVYLCTVYLLESGPAVVPVRLTEFSGRVTIRRYGKTIPPEKGKKLFSGDMIRTNAGSSVVLSYENEHITITADSRELDTSIEIPMESTGKRVILKNGMIRVNVAHQNSNFPFVLDTPHAQTFVLGTVFRLFVRDEYTRLEVVEGKVRFSANNGSASLDVENGRSAEVGPDKPMTLERLTTYTTTIRPLLVSSSLESTAPAFSIVRTEALRSNNGPGGRPLPLVAHWHRRSLPPSFQIELIKKGYPLLPWLSFSYRMKEIEIQKSYAAVLKILRQNRMPIMLLYGNQWESPFYCGEKYRNLSVDKTGLGIHLDGSRMNKVSPFSPIAPWHNLGRQWTDNPAAECIQKLYPDPPLVLFCSNNQPKVLRWHQAGTSRRYMERYGKGRGSDFKRRIFGDNWIKRYQALFSGMREGLDRAAWKQNIRFVGFNAFGPDHFGRWKGWKNYSLVTQDRICPDWYVWDGSVTELYDNDWEPGKRAFSLWSMQTEAMNLVFMKQEAIKVKPDFWFELIFWDGDIWSKNTKKAAMHTKAGVDYSPGYYKGWTQYCMWLLTPRVAREWHSSIDDRQRWWHYFQGVLDAVCAVHYDSVLKKFWRQGRLVANTAVKHPFRINIPQTWKDLPRWYHLQTDLDPKIPVEKNGTISVQAKGGNPNVPVWTLARVVGKQPDREWLLYVFAPLGEKKNVQVKIPGCGTVRVDAPVRGAFYYIQEVAENRTIHYQGEEK